MNLWDVKGVPHKGWKCEGVIDVGDGASSSDEIEYEQCEMCGNEKIRYLIINAARGLDKDENDKKGKLIRQERYAGSMTRSFYIGENVQKEDVEATYRHGVLTLTVPKKAIEKVPEKNLIAIEG